MNNILVWAHRGASGYAPENTLAAYELAAKMGVDGIELDIQLTKDNEIVVCHDERIDRTSNGGGYVKDFTLVQLKKFEFSNKNLAFEGCRIPTMREVFELVKPTGMTINIELKTGIFFYPGIEEKIVKMAHEYGMEERVIYSSFNHYSVREIQKLDPAAKTGLLYSDGFIEVPAYGKALGVTALHPSLIDLGYPNYMEDCRKYGLDVNVWTVNRRRDIELCKQLGVNAVITNYPDKARRILEN